MRKTDKQPDIFNDQIIGLLALVVVVPPTVRGPVQIIMLLFAVTEYLPN